MAAEVDEVVGPKGRHNADRRAKRHGHEETSVTLGARRVAVNCPRVRTADDRHHLAVLMLDGIDSRAAAGRPLGITTEGVKVPLGLWEGSTRTGRWPPR